MDHPQPRPPIDQGYGRGRVAIALAHQVLHRHLQFLSQVMKRAELTSAVFPDRNAESVGRFAELVRQRRRKIILPSGLISLFFAFTEMHEPQGVHDVLSKGRLITGDRQHDHLRTMNM
jgi:hypothetical protein